MGFLIGGRSLWMMAGGALGVLAALSFDKSSEKVRPVAVGAVKEGYAFKEWVATRFEQLKEDIEDIVAEAVYEQEKEAADAADIAKREEALLQKIEKMVEDRLADIRAETKEG